MTALLVAAQVDYGPGIPDAALPPPTSVKAADETVPPAGCKTEIDPNPYENHGEAPEMEVSAPTVGSVPKLDLNPYGPPAPFLTLEEVKSIERCGLTLGKIRVTVISQNDLTDAYVFEVRESSRYPERHFTEGEKARIEVFYDGLEMAELKLEVETVEPAAPDPETGPEADARPDGETTVLLPKTERLHIAKLTGTENVFSLTENRILIRSRLSKIVTRETEVAINRDLDLKSVHDADAESAWAEVILDREGYVILCHRPPEKD